MDKPIVIITTIYPFKNGKRPITVGAGPEGELTSLRAGVFADWQQLERQAYGELLAAASKPAPKGKGSGQVGKGRKTGQPGKRKDRRQDSLHAAAVEMSAAIAAEAAAVEADQVGPAAAELPEIEGDTEPADDDTPAGDDETQLELTLEGSDG